MIGQICYLDDSAPSSGDPLSPTNTSGSRKRSSSAATQSTATSSSKKAKAAKATDSTATSPSKKGLWVNPSASRKKQLKVTNLLQKLVVISESKDDKEKRLWTQLCRSRRNSRTTSCIAWIWQLNVAYNQAAMNFSSLPMCSSKPSGELYSSSLKLRRSTLHGSIMPTPIQNF